MSPENTRLLIVVDNADYRAHLSDIYLPEMITQKLSDRLSQAELHILEAAAHWSGQLQEVAIFSCHSAQLYSEVSYLGIRLMGSGVSDTGSEYVSDRDRIKLIADFCPTHIVLTAPNYPAIKWATRHNIPSIALLSDWQGPLGWRQQWHHNRLVKRLNHPSVEWVGNHGVFACKILKASGIQGSKLIPWEWPQPQKLNQYVLPKQIRAEQSAIDLVYAGPLDARAGLGDLLTAISHIYKKGTYTIKLKVIDDRQEKQAASPIQSDPTKSPDQLIQHTNYSNEHTHIIPHSLELLQIQAQQLGIDQNISFSSSLSSDHIVEQMREADLVVIPGCPKAFPVEPPPSLYMAMAARTPIIATDHPHFDEHLSHGVNAMIFPAGNDKSMAHRIERIMGQPQLYTQLSEASEVALTTLKVPARWSELINRWLLAGVENAQWLCNCAFSSGRYQNLSMRTRQLQSLQQAR